MRRPPIMASARRPRRGRKSWWDVCPVPATRRAFGLLDGAGSHPVATQRKTVPRFDGRLWRESGAAASRRPIFALVATAPDPRWRRRMAGKGATATVSPARVGLSAPIGELSSGACRVFRRPRRYRAPTRRNARQAPLRSFRPIPPESYRESSPPTAATGGCPAGYLRVLLPHPAAGHPWPALDIPCVRGGLRPVVVSGRRSTANSAGRAGLDRLQLLSIPIPKCPTHGRGRCRRSAGTAHALRAFRAEPADVGARCAPRAARS